jgi:pyruvate dehydrogenase E1 component alpha subunit
MSGKIPGGLHLSIGQEAVAVGIAAALQPQDLLACSHRSHHHALAKGLAPNSLMAELYGKATGCRGGRGGSMHLADPSVGFLGGNGIVGAGVGIAMGAALGSQLRGMDQVSVGLFGDGGANTGRTWESINIASVWKLPLIAVCENNMYAVETPTERLTGGGSISRRAEGFGLPVSTVDGQDVVAMYRATLAARERAARGEGPTFIEARTYRYEGHSTGQIINYRTIEEVNEWRGTKDPIQRLRQALHRAGGLEDAAFDGMVLKARETVADAIAFADASPLPDPIEATRDVTGHELGLGNAR